MSLYFVTGASGVVGSAMVPVILEKTDAEVRVLLRTKDDKGNETQSLDERFDELVEFWMKHYPRENDEYKLRVKPMQGDITEPNFGLSDPDRSNLTDNCTNIIHSAASVRMNLPLAQAEQTAVLPVTSVIALGEQFKSLRKAEFVSTVGVGGRWDGPLPERWIDEEREFHNTYETAKAKAETVIRAALDRGFPATVHRPSMVVGDARSGAVIHFQIFYHLCEFLSGKRTFGLYPRLGEATLDIVSNDFVAQAIVASSIDLTTIGEIFHLCSGPTKAARLRELRTTVQAKFKSTGHRGRLPTIDLSRENFTRVMNAIGRFLPERDRRAIKTLPIFLDYLTGIQQFGNDESNRRLAALGVTQKDNAQIIEQALSFYLAAN